MIETCHEAQFDRVATIREDDRNSGSRRLSGLCHSAATGAVDHGHLAADEIGRQR